MSTRLVIIAAAVLAVLVVFSFFAAEQAPETPEVEEFVTHDPDLSEDSPDGGATTADEDSAGDAAETTDHATADTDDGDDAGTGTGTGTDM